MLNLNFSYLFSILPFMNILDAIWSRRWHLSLRNAPALHTINAIWSVTWLTLCAQAWHVKLKQTNVKHSTFQNTCIFLNNATVICIKFNSNTHCYKNWYKKHNVFENMFEVLYKFFMWIIVILLFKLTWVNFLKTTLYEVLYKFNSSTN